MGCRRLAAGQPPLAHNSAANAPGRDRYHSRPAIQAARATAVAHILGDVVLAWDEIVAGNYARFEQAYTTFLAY